MTMIWNESERKLQKWGYFRRDANLFTGRIFKIEAKRSEPVTVKYISKRNEQVYYKNSKQSEVFLYRIHLKLVFVLSEGFFPLKKTAWLLWLYSGHYCRIGYNDFYNLVMQTL
jgi:hypothetical protein